MIEKNLNLYLNRKLLYNLELYKSNIMLAT